MNLRMPIGVSGVAGAGKDLFFKILSKKIKIEDMPKPISISGCSENHWIKEFTNSIYPS